MADILQRQLVSLFYLCASNSFAEIHKFSWHLPVGFPNKKASIFFVLLSLNAKGKIQSKFPLHWIIILSFRELNFVLLLDVFEIPTPCQASYTREYNRLQKSFEYVLYIDDGG